MLPNTYDAKLVQERFEWNILNFVSKRMNTSHEQVGTTSAVCYSEDFNDDMKVAARYLLEVARRVE